MTVTITGVTPTAVATQIGSGQFTGATPSSGKLTLSLPTGTTNFAVAYACPPLTYLAVQNFETVYEVSTLDGTSFSFPCAPSGAGTSGTLTGSIDAGGIPNALDLSLFAQDGSDESFESFDIPSTFIDSVPTGTDRVEVLAYGVPSPIGTGVSSYPAVAARSFSAQAVPGALNGGNTIVLGLADEVTEEGITYSALPSGFISPNTEVNYVADGASILLASEAAAQYPVMPAGATESGDSYTFLSYSFNANSEVTVYKSLSTAGPLSVTFPAPWTYAGPTPAAHPVFDFAYSGFSGNSNPVDSVLLLWPLYPEPESALQVYATGNYLNGSTSLAVPDLSGLSGFFPLPASSAVFSWEATIDQGPYPSLQQTIPANSTTASVYNSGTYTVP